jgi:hypothetical protein
MFDGAVIGAGVTLLIASCGGAYAVGLKVAGKRGLNGSSVKIQKSLSEEFVSQPICQLRQAVCVEKLGRKLDRIMEHLKIPVFDDDHRIQLSPLT